MRESIFDGTVQGNTTMAWKEFVDHLWKDEKFKEIWTQAESIEVVKGSHVRFWRNLTQQAFMQGYQAGFTDRIFKGDVNEHTK